MFSAKFILHEQLSQRQWDDFVESSAQGSLYARTWFLNSSMPGWGAVVVSKDDRWQAVMPLRICQKYGIGYALQPSFSQYLGVLFAPFLGKANQIIHKKREILQTLIAALPADIRLFSYNFSPEFDYFLPFLRNGFEMRPRMNLTLSLRRPLEQIVGDFSTSILNHLKKARQNGLSCREGTAIQVLSERMLQYGFIRTVSEQQTLESLWRSAALQGRGFLLEVIGPDGQIQCSGLFLIEKEKAVFVASALDRPKRQFGSNSLLVVEAIKKCKSLGINELDFKGSMLSGVEQFFLGFNPQQVLYFNITRNRLGMLERIVYRALKRHLYQPFFTTPGRNGTNRNASSIVS